MTKPDPITDSDAPPPPGRPDRYPTLFALMREHGIDPMRVLAEGFGIDGYRYGELIDRSKGVVTGNRLTTELPIGDRGWAYREMQWPSPEIGAAMVAAFEADLRRPGTGTAIKPYRLVP
jgi:hypothetical protein